MGDFNAMIGKGRCRALVGDHGLGVKNELGYRIKLFIEEEEFIILNTFFKLPPRRFCIWTSPKDQSGWIVKNQFDYILITKRFCNSCLGVKTYPGTDIESDHCPVVGKFRVRLKRCKKTQ